MYPHERSLVKKFAGKPFVIVGVNSDKTRAELLDAMARNDLAWSSFFDGGSTGGPIATRWGVRGWPTIYVLDENGVIRGKNARGKRLESLLDELVEQAVAAAEKRDK